MARRKRMVWWIAGSVAAGVLALWVWPSLRPIFRGGAQAAADLLGQAGPWGPALVIGLQVVQSVVSPLPAWPVTVAAGARYGSVCGTLLSLTGGMIGASINFWIARRFGQTVVRHTVGQEWLERAARLGPLHFLILSLFGRLIPIASFDLVAYVAGIGRVSLGLFLAAALAGQAPAFFAYAFFGSDLAAANEAGIWGSAVMLLFIALTTFGRRLWKFLTGRYSE